MRKHLIGIFAVIMAIALSAFTARDFEKPKVTDPYWYNYNPVTNQLTGLVGQMSQSTLIATTNCKNHVSQPVCAKGYASSQGTTFPITAPAGATDVLRQQP